MLTKVTRAIAIMAMTGGAVLAGAGSASAAHCVDTENSSPGFSYFGNDHVQEKDHNGDEPGQPEGGKEGPHAGTSGASNCNETAGNPSERAPGQNRP